MTESSRIADAVEAARWNDARFLVAVKVARALDKTESPRDAKALSLSLIPLIDECERQGVGQQETETPLDAIMQAAEDMKAEIAAQTHGAK